VLLSETASQKIRSDLLKNWSHPPESNRRPTDYEKQPATANLSKLEKDQKNKSNDIQATKDSFPGLQRIMAPVRDADRQQAWSQIKQEFSRFGDANGFEAPGEVLMAP